MAKGDLHARPIYHRNCDTIEDRSPPHDRVRCLAVSHRIENWTG